MSGIGAWLSAHLQAIGAFTVSTVATTAIATGAVAAFTDFKLPFTGGAPPPSYAQQVLDARCGAVTGRSPGVECPLPAGLRQACGCEPREQAVLATACQLPRPQAARLLECDAMGLTGDPDALGTCMRDRQLTREQVRTIPARLGALANDEQRWIDCAAGWASGAGGTKTGEHGTPPEPIPPEPIPAPEPEPETTPCVETGEEGVCRKEAERHLRKAPGGAPHPKLADRFAALCQSKGAPVFCKAAALAYLERKQADRAAAQKMVRRACQTGGGGIDCLYLGLQHAVKRPLDAEEYRGVQTGGIADRCAEWQVDDGDCKAAQALSNPTATRAMVANPLQYLPQTYAKCRVEFSKEAPRVAACDSLVELTDAPPPRELSKGQQRLVRFYQALYREGACDAGFVAACRR